MQLKFIMSLLKATKISTEHHKWPKMGNNSKMLHESCLQCLRHLESLNCTITFLLSNVQHFSRVDLLLISNILCKFIFPFSCDENIAFCLFYRITGSFLLNDQSPLPTPKVLFYCPINYPKIKLYIQTCCVYFVYLIF